MQIMLDVQLPPDILEYWTPIAFRPPRAGEHFFAMDWNYGSGGTPIVTSSALNWVSDCRLILKRKASRKKETK